MARYIADRVLMNMSASSQDMAVVFDSVRNAFLSCSFVRTVQGPSGSITSPDDFSVLSPTTGADQVRAFDIFAFNDSWQATRPLFIKVTYGSAIASNVIGIRYNMGTQHDNSGSFVGVDTLVELARVGVSGGNSRFFGTVRASGDGSYFTIVSFPENTDNAQIATFERFYSGSGTTTGSGFHMLGMEAVGKVIYSQATNYGERPPRQEAYTVVNSRPSRVPAVYDGNLILGLIYPYVGKPLNPSPNVLLGESTTFSVDFMEIDYTVYNTKRTYVNAGANVSSTGNSRIYSTGRYLLRYE